MNNNSGERIAVGVDVLTEYFLKLLQRDSAISNNTYLAAIKILKEERKNVNSNSVLEA